MNPRLRQWLWTFITAAVSAALYLILPASAPAYLAAFVLFASIPLGAASILMLFHSSAALWADPIRPSLEQAAALAPLLVVLFRPIAFAAPSLYPWAHSAPEARVHPYFDYALVSLRTVTSLAIWSIGGPLLAARSRTVPQGSRAGPGLRAASAAGLIIYFLTVTFTFIDWLATLEPHWASSMFGVIIVCSQGLTALALCAAVACCLPADPKRPLILRDVANLILAAALLHAYVAFSQFFIIWNGNVPERTSWYIPRTRGLWLVVIICTTAMQFAIPFGIVLFRSLKTSPRIMIGVAVLLLIGAALESAWIAIPSAPYDSLTTRLFYPFFAIALLAIVFRSVRLVTPHAEVM